MKKTLAVIDKILTYVNLILAVWIWVLIRRGA